MIYMIVKTGKKELDTGRRTTVFGGCRNSDSWMLAQAEQLEFLVNVDLI